VVRIYVYWRGLLFVERRNLLVALVLAAMVHCADSGKRLATLVKIYASPLVKNNGTMEFTNDGLIQLKGDFNVLYVYVPLNLAYVSVEVKNATEEVQVLKLCDVGWFPTPMAII